MTGKNAPSIFLMLLLLLLSAASPAFCGEAPGFLLNDREIPGIEWFMKIGYAGSPSISPDGETVYFTNSFISPAQLFRLDAKGGYPYQLTYRDDPVIYPALSPDGRWVAFLSDSNGNEQYQIFLMDAKSGRWEALTSEPSVRHESVVWAPDSRSIYFRANGESPRDFNVYQLDLGSRKKKLVVAGPGQYGPCGTSLDGSLLFYYNFNSNVDKDLFLQDLKTGKGRHLTPHKGSVLNSFVTLSPDNRTMYFLSNDNEQGEIKLASMDLETGKHKFIYDTKSPWEVEDACVNPARDKIALVVNREGYGDLRLLDLATMRELPVPENKGIVSSVSLASGSRMAYAYSTPTTTADVYLWNWESKENRRLTTSSYLGIDRSLFVEPQLIRYPSFDGLEIPAFLYLPPGWESRKGEIPFVIEYHGGPEGQSRPVFQRHFNYLLQNGFGIMTPNIRGSKGYGRKYKSLDDYKKRMDSVKDGYYAAKYLVDKGYSRKGKIGIKGTSYGGYMVMALVTEYPDMWGAAYESVGIVDLENFLKNTSSYRRMLREAEYGPLTDIPFLKSVSPIYKFDRIKTPLMISHGKNDPRVPVSEAYMIIDNLRKRGVEVNALIFDDEGHGVSKMKNRLRLYREMAEFFKTHLK
jgi:dipeptidyl aminopeptidase/acylaminoacyl peptidase